MERNNYEQMTVPELKNLARERGLTRYSRLRKSELIRRLREQSILEWGNDATIVDRICGVWLSLCVCVRLASRVCVCLASACICLACVSRLSASVHVKGSECMRLRLVRRSSCLASVSHLSRICLASVVLSRICLASVVLSCICLASVSRLSASVVLSRICLASVSRRSSCLASVSHLSRVGRLVSHLSRVCLASVCLSVLVNACGNWLILCRSSFKEFKRFFAIVILSYNVPMPKYPSHHLIYVFYHPMPIMPLY